MSADARAMGMTTMSAATGTSMTNVTSSSSDSNNGGAATSSSDSVDSSVLSTVSDTHSHTNHMLGYYFQDSSHLMESSHSGTGLSHNLSGDT